MNFILQHIRARYRPKKKTYTLSVKPEQLHKAIEAFPSSVGFWGSASFELIQFDYTYFELQPTFGSSSSGPNFTPNLLGSLEEVEGGKILMKLRTYTAPSWYVTSGILLLILLLLLIDTVIKGHILNFLGTGGILLLFFLGLLFYKDRCEKVVIRRFIEELASHLTMQGAVNTGLSTDGAKRWPSAT